MKLLERKTALVTGAGQGNGAAIAKGFASHGARVVVTDRDAALAEETAAAIREAGGDACAFQLDVTELGPMRNTARDIEQAVGPVNVLVNNAGVLRRDSIDAPEAREAWDQCMQVNATGVFNTTLAFVPQLRRTKGNIVNIASITAFSSVRTFPGYSASKAAVVAMTKAFAVKLAPDGVRVNAVAPGPFATPMTALTRNNEQANDYIVGRILLGRFGSPDELIGPVAFMASDLASFITGETLVVDGGVLAE
ncbi:MAG: SDR family NAD(P)-dependent oxidoreductase [Dehalococcoidia bacterium]